MLSDVSCLDGNAIDNVNKMAGKVREQAQFATSLQTFTDLLDLIDSKSNDVNMFNFLTDTGMGMMLTGDNTSNHAHSSPLTRYLGRDSSTIGHIMNGVIKRKLKVILKDLVWQQLTLDVYDAMKNDFMKPAISVVDELLSLGVNVTLWDGLNNFFSLQRTPLHFCRPYDITNGFVKAHKNLQHYTILEAGQAVCEVAEKMKLMQCKQGASSTSSDHTKVLLDPILRTNPDVGKIYVLIKAKDNEAAMKRLKNEEIHGKNYHSFVSSKQVPVVGNVREANIGIAPELAKEIAEEVDVIVNSAANTTFDERYDVALDINTVGPFRIMSFAQRFRRLKLFLQVSTGQNAK
uniref:Fatty acyl-CoA reductase n=1 Tax=Oryza punctata TaxID=4537 RepID=A0A0E0KEL4_ORYPU